MNIELKFFSRVFGYGNFAN